jgi:hypothetical protein
MAAVSAHPGAPVDSRLLSHPDLSWVSATPEERKVGDDDLANADANNDPGRAWMRVESAAGKKSYEQVRTSLVDSCGRE